MPKEKDEQYEFTGISINTRILICGASGSGKSNALMNYLLLTSEPKNGTFAHIFLVYKVEEPLYEFLKDKLKDKITLMKGLDKFPSVQEFPEKNKEKYLCVFDDVVNDKSKENIKKLNEYFAYSRKKNITCIFLTQSYFSTLKFLRENINYIILTSIKSTKDLKAICREYLQGDITVEKLKAMYEYATKEQLNFLKIDMSAATSQDKKYSKNFTDYLNPTEF